MYSCICNKFLHSDYILSYKANHNELRLFCMQTTLILFTTSETMINYKIKYTFNRFLYKIHKLRCVWRVSIKGNLIIP